MAENAHDLVEKLHREAIERKREQDHQGRALVEAMFREAWERRRQEEERAETPS